MALKIKSRIASLQSRISFILAVFIVLCLLYSFIVPPFEASDELWHYPMVKYIADHRALPIQDAENVGPWRQEGSQPPLYYVIGAVATFWIDTSDVDVVRHLNPHADNGIATIDGNINLITHHPDAESFPWRGTTLAVHLIRFLSVLMGAATVYLTYRLSLELVPDQPNVALVAAAINAFTPMFIFISGAVNNDNLVIPLCSLALLLMIRIAKATSDGRQTTNSESRTMHLLPCFVQLGIVVGLALLTKESAGGLVLLTALTVAYVSWRERSPRIFLVGALATGGSALLIAGWWYLRNLQLYGDLLGQNVFIEILGQRDVPADLTQLWRERISFMRGYWGNFGGLNVPMPDWIYAVLDGFLVLAAFGLVIALIFHFSSKYKLENGNTDNLVRWLIALLWPASVVVLWIVWATTTWSSQGRLIFSAISVWSLLLALGWYSLTHLMPRGWRGVPDRKPGGLGEAATVSVFGSFPIFLFIISLIAPFAWIRPAYAPPPALNEGQIATISHRIDATFFHPSRGQIKLLGYDAPVQAAYPGQSVPVTLYWETVEPFHQDYSIFLHLVDRYDLLPAQRDAFPGAGTLSTQWLTPGRRWAERRVLTLPDNSFSPNDTVFEVGFYDYRTGERLAVVDAHGQIAGDHVRFGQVEVLAHPGDWPNPISIDFGGEMELVGYDLDRRALRRPEPAEGRPGETATLTLYWRGQRQMALNYSISTQFVNEHGIKAAQKDAWPFDGAAPTSLWDPGKLI